MMQNGPCKNRLWYSRERTFQRLGYRSTRYEHRRARTPTPSSYPLPLDPSLRGRPSCTAWRRGAHAVDPADLDRDTPGCGGGA